MVGMGCGSIASMKKLSLPVRYMRLERTTGSAEMKWQYTSDPIQS
jgi:hypothetical protein